MSSWWQTFWANYRRNRAIARDIRRRRRRGRGPNHLLHLVLVPVGLLVAFVILGGLAQLMGW